MFTPLMECSDWVTGTLSSIRGPMTVSVAPLSMVISNSSHSGMFSVTGIMGAGFTVVNVERPDGRLGFSNHILGNRASHLRGGGVTFQSPIKELLAVVAVVAVMGRLL